MVLNDGKHYKVHRLVADAFIPNPNNYSQVNHKDENPLNNCVDNLEWCTNQYNAKYSARPFTDEHRRKLSEAKKGRKQIKDENGKWHWSKKSR